MTKSPDPTLDRIRRVRHEISEEVGHDPKRLVAHYLEYQKQFSDRLVQDSRDSGMRSRNRGE